MQEATVEAVPMFEERIRRRIAVTSVAQNGVAHAGQELAQLGGRRLVGPDREQAMATADAFAQVASAGGERAIALPDRPSNAAAFVAHATREGDERLRAFAKGLRERRKVRRA